jgi:hypothetical protein
MGGSFAKNSCRLIEAGKTEECSQIWEELARCQPANILAATAKSVTDGCRQLVSMAESVQSS